MPMLVQVSAQRYLIIMQVTEGVTGGTVGNGKEPDKEFIKGEVVFGPASYDACIQWIKDN